MFALNLFFQTILKTRHTRPIKQLQANVIFTFVSRHTETKRIALNNVALSQHQEK